jgi:hypothetical protein
MMRNVMLSTLLVVALADAVPAQDPPAIIAGDRAASAEVSKIIESARASGLPDEPILATIGYAVNIAHASPSRIVAAVRATVARLQEARDALAPNPTGIDIAAGGNALSANVSTKSLQDIRRASGNRSVAVPLGVLTQLVANKVDEKKATKIVMNLIRQGATADQLIALGNDVNSDILAGTKPNNSVEIRMTHLTAVLGVPTSAASAASDQHGLTAGASNPTPPGKKKP